MIVFESCKNMRQYPLTSNTNYHSKLYGILPETAFNFVTDKKMQYMANLYYKNNYIYLEKKKPGYLKNNVEFYTQPFHVKESVYSRVF